ncbi:MAG: hypothetical protein PHC62_04555 [Candidatus Izemoplasmatales bacterium]|jgi:hypothetical protein|nr:hypothetical protein [Candidatus Izemoplasmatales bacterium]
MNAGFLKRAFSSLVDIIVVLSIVYVSFSLIGKNALQNKIPNFNEINTAYQEIATAYQADYATAEDEYSALKVLADGNDALETEAAALYADRIATINAQNLVDIEPYNRPLTTYYMNVILYHVIGFLILMSVYTVALSGKTLGRTISRTKLEGSVNPISIFLHDIILKYFFILLSFFYSPYIAIVLLIVSLIIDMILINFTKNKSTLRDTLLKITVSKSNYWK